MRFFLYNNQEKLIAIKTDAISANLSEEIGYYDSLTADFPKTEQNIKDFRHTYYIGIPVTDGYQLFKMQRPTFKEESISITAIESAEDDLDVQGYINDRRFLDKTLAEVLEVVFDGTQWDFRLCDIDNTSNSLNFYKTTRKEALEKAQKLWNFETQFRYKFKGNKITQKVCEVHSELGWNTGKRLIKGKNVTSFEYAKDQTELYTAAIGRGAGLEMQDEEGNATGGYSRSIEFTNVEWNKDNFDPVDKPAGQRYVEIPEATAKYGWIDKDGNRQPRMAIVEFSDDKDERILLEDTYQWLLERSQPRVSVTTTVEQIGDVQLGDRMIAIDYDSPTFSVEARAMKIERDLLDNNNTEVQLGNYVILSQLEQDEIAEDYLLKRINKNAEETEQKLIQQDEKFTNYITQIQEAMKRPDKEKEEILEELKAEFGLSEKKLDEKMHEELYSIEESMHEMFGEETKKNKKLLEQAFEENKTNWKDTVDQIQERSNIQIDNVYQQLDEIQEIVNGDTAGTIHLIKEPGKPSQIAKFIAKNDNGSEMEFSGNGLVFRDKEGFIQSAITSNGKVAGETLTGVTVEAMNINSAKITSGTIDGALITGNTIKGGSIFGSTISAAKIYTGEIYGSLKFYDRQGGSMSITIGGDGEGGLNPEHGGEVIYVTSNNYSSMLSSGQLAVSGSEGTTRIHPNSIEINSNKVLHENNWKKYIKDELKSMVFDWVQGWLSNS